MAVTEETPSQASRAEAVAEAGMGAGDHPSSTGIPSTEDPTDLEKAGNGKPVSPSGSSVGHDVKDEKVAAATEEPQRSKGKTLLIMLALCVRFLGPSASALCADLLKIAVFLAALDTVNLRVSTTTRSYADHCIDNRHYSCSDNCNSLSRFRG